MGKKIWTLQTLVEQLRAKVHEIYDEDILNPTASILDVSLGEILEELKNAEFKSGFGELPGQQALQIGAPDQPAYAGTTGETQLKEQVKAKLAANKASEDGEDTA